MAASAGLKKTVEEHKALLDALVRRDPSQAAALMRSHISRAAARYGIMMPVQG
jgi:DNA-binding GntR family transcriptional regulator